MRFDPTRRFREFFLKQAFRTAKPLTLRPSLKVITSALQDAVGWEAKLATIAASRKPILVGPWVSEIGFEVLYWIPFLTWFCKFFRVPPERIFIVSRGGVRDWYRAVGFQYIEIFDSLSEAEFRKLNLARIEDRGGRQKHKVPAKMDDEILARVRSQLPADYEWLHPLYMYQLFSGFWRGRLSNEIVDSHAEYLAFTGQDLPKLDLPADYYCAKFYFSDALENKAEVQQTCTELLARLRQRKPVVLLETGMAFDDHTEAALGAKQSGSGLHPLIALPADKITAANNLAVQSAVIAGSKGFFGTYGGFSYIAPFYGVPSWSFYLDAKKFKLEHLDIMHTAGVKLGEGKATCDLNFSVMSIQSARSALDLL